MLNQAVEFAFTVWSSGAVWRRLRAAIGPGRPGLRRWSWGSGHKRDDALAEEVAPALREDAEFGCALQLSACAGRVKSKDSWG
jgi:hypothetical protein